MILLQTSSDATKSTASEFAYALGYFVGEFFTLIFLFAGLILGFILFLFLRNRNKKMDQDSE